MNLAPLFLGGAVRWPVYHAAGGFAGLSFRLAFGPAVGGFLIQ
jgi:hypothetical protein